ncbi:caspase family protein [Candidatus Entotheonella palauensis]|uniref:caspase family protein n=1 Tax=Candidatus Entotheonella palauensis TaxID=93172 RepID=UPI000B7D27CA|nr:caspase family protein [Candidatus Entotheonella palauensis]
MCRLTSWLLIAFIGLVSFVHASNHTKHVKRAVPPDIRKAEGFDTAESAGLFIGIRTFADTSFAEVPYAVDDAIDLAHLFTLELSLIDPKKVILALAGMPQKSASNERLQALLKAGVTRKSARLTEIYAHLARQGVATGRRGLFVVTLATHGFSDRGRDFLVSTDTRRRFLKRTGIEVADVFDVVAQAKAPRRLVLLDACRERLSRSTRASGIEAESAMGQAFADAIAKASGQVVLSGTTLGGYAYDDDQRQNGVFTAAVLDGLRGQASADKRYFITARTLADYIDNPGVRTHLLKSHLIGV